MSLFTKGHAVVIGVGADLPNTVIDAEGLAKMLRDPERCAYPADHVRILTQEKAARNEVIDALDQLAKEVSADSTVIIYFSGHGYELSTAIGKQYFLMPFGYDMSDLSTTAISGPEFMAKLEAVKAQKMLILLDCCHAGGMDREELVAKAPGITFTKAPMPPEAARLLGEGTGRVIIASSQADQKSYTGYPYSQFTQALLEALAGADAAQQDGFARAADLAMYTGRTVPRYTKDRQIPVLNFDQADNFPVAYYAGGDTQPKGLPAEAQRQESPADEDSANQPSTTTIHAENTGSGGQAVGDHNKVGGAGSVAADTITGDVMMGENARKINAENYIERQDVQNNTTFDQSGQTVHGNQTNINDNVNTAGGAFIGGNVNTGGGDFVGRDKHIGGDDVRGDKIARDKVAGDKMNVGNISGSNVAIGRGAQVHVNQDATATVNDITAALQPVLMAAQSAPAAIRADAVAKADALQAEVVKGAQADDEVVGSLLEDLAKLVPDAGRAIGAAFGQPLLNGIVGPVTKFVLRRLGIA